MGPIVGAVSTDVEDILRGSHRRKQKPLERDILRQTFQCSVVLWHIISLLLQPNKALVGAEVSVVNSGFSSGLRRRYTWLVKVLNSL